MEQTFYRNVNTLVHLKKIPKTLSCKEKFVKSILRFPIVIKRSFVNVGY